MVPKNYRIFIKRCKRMLIREMTKEHAIEYGVWWMNTIKLPFHNEPLIDGISYGAHGSRFIFDSI